MHKKFLSSSCNNSLPKNIEEIQIEYDLLCDYGQINDKYECLMKPQWLNRKNFYCGFHTFSNKILNNKNITFIN